MILTLTVNPAIDLNVTADHLAFEDRGYILSTHESAGGRGINASHVIHSFSGRTLALAVSGGKNGARFEEYLGKLSFPAELVRIQNEIRTNLTISDQQGLTIKLNERGPSVASEEVARLEEAVARKLPEASWLMICGSFPPGMPAEFCSKLVCMARERGVKVLVDTDDEPLLRGLEANPTVVSPNQHEAERLLSRALVTRSHFVEAADRIRAMGAESVVLSLGSRGAIGAFGNDEIVEAVPPRVDAVSPIGAGDALAAALVWALTRGSDFPDAVRWGVAAGTASAQLPGLTFASLEQTREVYERVELRKLR